MCIIVFFFPFACVYVHLYVCMSRFIDVIRLV